ncbi:MAG TPA: ATP-dependent helicase, partial [Kiritimatiellia bacterium]|nr:ATP-dependent helicase [Kiritimatiellia bacterium]
ARQGLQGIQAALALVLDYFRLEKRAFMERYFPGRKKELERAATAEAYRRVVEELGDDEQRRVVEASEEENLLVLAGPGSGKTKTVVHRIAWLLKIRHVPAQSILALCFNHDAAVQLRRRLRELAGDAARGVTVMTYHALAMRLTGTSFRALADAPAVGKSAAAEVDFARPIHEAIALLKGQVGAEPGERDDARDRLLAGFRFILVDEYQDVDDGQYDLISALAGRTLQEPDAKLGLLAVGDDDQSIYGFRGADVRFIRRFEADYEAGIYGLTSNYRSTAVLLAAAGRIIAGNRRRMKADMPLHVDGRRKNEFPGEPVRLIAAAGLPAQTAGLLRQVQIWRASGADWSDMAILGVNHDDLDAFRSVAEAESIPLNVRVVSESRRSGSGLPPLWRMRESMWLLERLRDQAGKEIDRADMQNLLAGLCAACGRSRWTDLLADAVAAFSEETALADAWSEHLHEHLAGSRRDGRLGVGGVWLSTIHAAKGTEHGQVAVAGAWQAHERAGPEEARRLLYVGMTRAKRALAVVDRTDRRAALLQPLREAPGIVRETTAVPEHSLALKNYRILGPADFDLGFAGRGEKARVQRIADGLRDVRAGDSLKWAEDSSGILLLAGRRPVASLSREGSRKFRNWTGRVATVRVLGVYGWRKEDVEPEWRGTYLADRWGVPLCEVVLRADNFETAVHPCRK